MVESKKITKFLLVLFIFIFAASLRLWNIDKMGRTWDEGAQVELGYKFIKLIENRDFSNPLWKYPYHPPLTKYLYGWAAQYDIIGHKDGKPIFDYDYMHARLISVLFSSLTAVLVLLIGWKYLSPFIGSISAVIFSMFPFLLGLSQLATIESVLIFFFTGSVYSFLNFLQKINFKNAILTGFFVGLAIETKYTNILLIPLFLWIYSIWYFYKNKKRDNFFNPKMLIILTSSFFTFFIFWPIPWFHLKEILDLNYKMRIIDTAHSIPEVFFGRLMFVPKLYYVIEFLITTPFLILILFLIGLKNISDKKKWIMYAIVAWFIFPFIQSFYNFRQHGVRYIIEIYAPLSLIAGIGFNYVTDRFTKQILVKIVIFIPVVIYMFIILFRITPYYLDYFNIVVGGAKNVYEKRLFQLGWWGQGGREAALYLKSVPEGSTVGIAHEPFASIPQINGLKIEPYKENKKYDYVIVGFFHIIRLGFDDSKIKKDYIPVYSVIADGAHIMEVYKKK